MPCFRAALYGLLRNEESGTNWGVHGQFKKNKDKSYQECCSLDSDSILRLYDSSSFSVSARQRYWKEVAHGDGLIVPFRKKMIIFYIKFNILSIMVSRFHLDRFSIKIQ